MLEDRAHDVKRMTAAPFKADMLIRSAVRVRPRPDKAATATFPQVTLGDSLEGWYALDDDAAKERAKAKLRLFIEVRDQSGQWTTLLDRRVRHKPNRQPISIETTDLAGTRTDIRVRVETSAKGAPSLGFDLELGATE